MAIREAVGAALNSTHLETQEHESAIDRVGALAHASKLGRALYHWRYAKQDRYAGPVLAELLRKARNRLRIGKFHVEHPTLVRACKQAMREWYSPQCNNCNGAREVVTSKLRMICPACSGSGVRRYPDAERLNALGIDAATYAQAWQARLQAILALMVERDAQAAVETRRQLREPDLTLPEGGRINALQELRKTG